MSGRRERSTQPSRCGHAADRPPTILSTRAESLDNQPIKLAPLSAITQEAPRASLHHILNPSQPEDAHQSLAPHEPQLEWPAEAASAALPSQPQDRHYRAAPVVSRPRSGRPVASGTFLPEAGGPWYDATSFSDSRSRSRQVFETGAQDRHDPYLENSSKRFRPLDYAGRRDWDHGFSPDEDEPKSSMSDLSISELAKSPQEIQSLTFDKGDGDEQLMIHVDTQTASRLQNEKRARNAEASMRFRQRRRNKEVKMAIQISMMDQRMRVVTAQRDFYHQERDILRDLAFDSPLRVGNFPRPPSPQFIREEEEAYEGNIRRLWEGTSTEATPVSPNRDLESGVQDREWTGRVTEGGFPARDPESPLQPTQSHATPASVPTLPPLQAQYASPAYQQYPQQEQHQLAPQTAHSQHYMQQPRQNPERPSTSGPTYNAPHLRSEAAAVSLPPPSSAALRRDSGQSSGVRSTKHSRRQHR